MEGKRIGVPLKSVGEFFLDRFFIPNNVPAQGITSVDMIFTHMVQHIKDGAIDALPEGYEVSENTKTGLPLLKKKK